MDVQLGQGIYSARMAARIARIRYQSFQAWAKANLIHGTKFKLGRRSETVYTYRDLLLIRLIVWLKGQGQTPRAIRKALDTIALMSGGGRDAWMKSTIYVSGNTIVAIVPEKPEYNPIAASQGPQKMALVFFPDLIDKLKGELVPPRFKHIDIDPWVLGGAPRIKGTRIPTKAVKAAQESDQDPLRLYPQLTDEQVAEVDEYEAFLEAA